MAVQYVDDVVGHVVGPAPAPGSSISTLHTCSGVMSLGLGTICWHNFEHNNFMLGCEHSGA